MPTSTNHDPATATTTPTTAATTLTTTSTTAAPSPARAIRRDRATLLHLLDAIDTEGWNGPTATSLLEYLRETMIRPLVVDVGLRGALSCQAEASAWQATWLALTKPALRSARSPWGVLWQIARRTILAEIVTARFATSERRAWELHVAVGDGDVHVPISLDVLLESGWEPADDAAHPIDTALLADVLADARNALVSVGWDTDLAARIVRAVAALDGAESDPRCIAIGWRNLATQLNLPPWQARRLTDHSRRTRCVAVTALPGATDAR